MIFDSIMLDRIIPALGWSLINSLWIGLIALLIMQFFFNNIRENRANVKYNLALAFYSIIIISTISVFVSYINSAAVFNNTDAEETSRIVLNNQAYILFNNIEISDTGNPVNSYLAAAVNLVNNNISVLIYLWLTGMFYYSIRTIGSYKLTRRLERDISPLRKYWNNKVKEVSNALRVEKAVSIAESVYVKSPLVIRHLKPLILLPVGMISSTPAPQVEAIIAHEIAHIKRHDYLVNLIQAIFDVIFFFNPFTRIISQRIREEREKCCDDLAAGYISDPIDLAKALTVALEYTKMIPAAAPAFASGKRGELYSRVKRIVSAEDIYSGGRSSRSSVMLLFALIFCSLLSLGFMDTINKELSPSQINAVDIPKIIERDAHDQNRLAELLNGDLLENGFPVVGNDSELNTAELNKSVEEIQKLLRQMSTNSDYMTPSKQYLQRKKEAVEELKHQSNKPHDKLDFSFNYEIRSEIGRTLEEIQLVELEKNSDIKFDLDMKELRESLKELNIALNDLDLTY